MYNNPHIPNVWKQWGSLLPGCQLAQLSLWTSVVHLLRFIILALGVISGQTQTWQPWRKYGRMRPTNSKSWIVFNKGIRNRTEGNWILWMRTNSLLLQTAHTSREAIGWVQPWLHGCYICQEYCNCWQEDQGLSLSQSETINRKEEGRHGTRGKLSERSGGSKRFGDGELLLPFLRRGRSSCHPLPATLVAHWLTGVWLF